MTIRGASMYRAIQQGRIVNQLLKENCSSYAQDMVCLIFYFFSKAVAKGHGFKKETFVIKDPGLKVLNFMLDYVKRKWKKDLYKEVLIDTEGAGAYPRKSTHFNSYYTYTKRASKNLVGSISKQKDFVHYGIDVAGNYLLPNKLSIFCLAG